METVAYKSVHEQVEGYTPRMCTLTAVKVIPQYISYEWDWLEDGLCWTDFSGYDEGMFDTLKSIINDISACPVSDESVLVSFHLIEEGEDFQQETFEVMVTYGKGAISQHVKTDPRFLMFDDKEIYSALTHFSYTVSDYVKERCVIQSVSSEY